LQNSGNRFRKVGDSKIRFLAQRLAIAVIDKNGAAAGGFRAVHVPPPIADEKAALQIDVMIGGSGQEQAGLRFPAFTQLTMPGAGVKTDFDRIERRHCRPQLLVHCFNGLPRLRSAADVRLIADNDQNKAGRFQLRARRGDAGVKLEFIDTRGRKGETVAQHGPVQDPVAIEENRALSYFVLSHFVCADFSAG
jgi:hypothetical protein